MRVIMNTELINSIGQVQKFLEGSNNLKFEGESVADKYKFIEKVLIQFSYFRLKRNEKGIVRSYICKVTGYQAAQITRLVKQYKRTGYVVRRSYKRRRFPKKYTDKDIQLLAKTDQLHELNGAAIKKILEREVNSAQIEYQNISKVSVSHIYNLRKDRRYRNTYTRYSKTKPIQVNIGERKKPQPNGKPGYIRIDTVHQGDFDGEKGVYHINAVDELTQWEIVASVEKISEYYLRPILEEILASFPFTILGFHSDNGSEYVNYVVSELLNKLLIKQTKSRSRHTNDNALVESKNASVIRKHMGYSHIPQSFAEEINQFNRHYLNPYLNFHKPCFFPTETIDSKGKIRKKYRYKDMMTPFDKLKSISGFQNHLKSDVSFETLNTIASEFSDNQFAERMVNARNKLWKSILDRVA